MKKFSFIFLALAIFLAKALPFNCGGGLFAAIAGGDTTAGEILGATRYGTGGVAAFGAVGVSYIDTLVQHENNANCEEKFISYLNKFFPTHDQVEKKINEVKRISLQFVITHVQEDYDRLVSNLKEHKNDLGTDDHYDYIQKMEDLMDHCAVAAKTYLKNAKSSQPAVQLSMLGLAAEIMQQGVHMAQEIFVKTQDCHVCTDSNFSSIGKALLRFATNLHITDELYWEVETQLWNYRGDMGLFEYGEPRYDAFTTKSSVCGHAKGKKYYKLKTCANENARREGTCCYYDTAFLGRSSELWCNSFNTDVDLPCEWGKCTFAGMPSKLPLIEKICLMRNGYYPLENLMYYFREKQYWELRKQNRDVWWFEKGGHNFGKEPDYDWDWELYDEDHKYKWMEAELGIAMLGCKIRDGSSDKCGSWYYNLDRLATDRADGLWDWGEESWYRRHNWDDNLQYEGADSLDIGIDRRRQLLENCEFEAEKEYDSLVDEFGPGALPNCAHSTRNHDDTHPASHAMDVENLMEDPNDRSRSRLLNPQNEE